MLPAVGNWEMEMDKEPVNAAEKSEQKKNAKKRKEKKVKAKKGEKPQKRRLNAVDAFLLLAFAALLITPAARLFYGRLTGPQYTDLAVVNFRIERTGVEALSILGEGDELFLDETGEPFGRLLTLTTNLSRDGQFASGSGTLEISGANIPSGFRTREGVYVIPFQSYTVTGGKSSMTIQLSDLDVRENGAEGS